MPPSLTTQIPGFLPESSLRSWKERTRGTISRLSDDERLVLQLQGLPAIAALLNGKPSFKRYQ
jgi:hypothetical protein